MGKTFFIIALALQCFSCGERNGLKKSIEQFRSKPVTLHTDRMKCLIDGNDTVVPIENNSMKYIIYTDAESCGSCTLKNFHLWNDILDKSRMYGKNLAFFFIFAPTPKDRQVLEQTLKTYSPDYPVYIDTLHVFERENPYMKSNIMLHSFLLDENNRVVLVGNPLKNKRIDEMFHDIMKKRLTYIASPDFSENNKQYTTKGKSSNRFPLLFPLA